MVPSLETLAVWSVKIWPQNGIIKAATKANNFFLKTQESCFAVTYLAIIFGRDAKILKYWVIGRHGWWSWKTSENKICPYNLLILIIQM